MPRTGWMVIAALVLGTGAAAGWTDAQAGETAPLRGDAPPAGAAPDRDAAASLLRARQANARAQHAGRPSVWMAVAPAPRRDPAAP